MKVKLSDATKILFISDAHIGAFSDEKNAQIEHDLIQLIDYAEKENYQIAILGDLFDYWIEYPSYRPALGERLLNRFAVFNQQSSGCIYITGNHDNWTLGHFVRLGFDVEPEYRLLHAGKKTALLLHGDAIGDNLQQLKRPPFHRLIRSAAFMKIYRSMLPPQTGIKVMKYFSRASRFFSFKKSEPDVLNRWSKKILKNEDINIILCGHDHQPRTLNFSYGTYINLGTFHLHRSLVEYNNGNFSLVKWNKESKTFSPLKL